jgi:ketosteroid isomerase-like protein
MKAYTPEEVDQVFPKVRVFSSGKMNKWDLVSDLYTPNSMVIDYDGTPRKGLEGILEVWSEWATRRRFTHGWTEHTLMLAEDIALKFYRFCNRGEDDQGQPFDFMTEGFWIGRKNDDGSWQVLIDVPWAGNNELVGNTVPSSPWQALLEPLHADTRIVGEDGTLSTLEAGRG